VKEKRGGRTRAQVHLSGSDERCWLTTDVLFNLPVLNSLTAILLLLIVKRTCSDLVYFTSVFLQFFCILPAGNGQQPQMLLIVMDLHRALGVVCHC
jgi:hypothetical protein